MPRPGDRRPLIADHAIAVLAAGGARALTHHAVDRATGIAQGSTSYYFRTRRELVVAVIRRVKEQSRSAFDAAAPRGEATVVTAAAAIESQLVKLAGERRDQALSVFALLPEVEGDPELRGDLARCLFSIDLAASLLVDLGSSDARRDALDLIDFLTGLLFGLLFGQRRELGPATSSVRNSVERFLRSCQGAEPSNVPEGDTEQRVLGSPECCWPPDGAIDGGAGDSE